MASRRRLAAVLIAAMTIATTSAEAHASDDRSGRSAHEVWLVDQSNTAFDGPAAAPAYGGRIYIYDGGRLQQDAAAAPAEVVELSQATSALCREQTGANPIRPHMLVFTRSGRHAVLAFVVSGHVVIYESESRQPVACFRTEVSPTGRQAHAAVLTPDERYILVANQNGKKLERIRTDFRRNRFVQEPEATLDLAAGLTPNGVPVQTPDDPTIRPDNAPICPFVPSSGYPGYVSLRGGGLLAVDPYSTPIRIVAEYPATAVARDGCGFVEADGWVYANGGNRATDLNRWFVYRLPVGGKRTYNAANPPNTPAVQVVDTDTSRPRDAHGVAATDGGKYVWIFDRQAHIAEVYRSRTGEKVSTLDLRRPDSQLPSVDIAATSPDERFIYTATRGPRPLSGAHAAVGDDPGVQVIAVGRKGTGSVAGHSAVSNLVNGLETADPHGIAVRRTGLRGPRAVAAPFKGNRYGAVPSDRVDTPFGAGDAHYCSLP